MFRQSWPAHKVPEGTGTGWLQPGASYGADCWKSNGVGEELGF